MHIAACICKAPLIPHAGIQILQCCYQELLLRLLEMMRP